MSDIVDKITPKAVKVFQGVSIYQVANSRFWYVRVWDRIRRRYIVKGTGETTQIAAKRVAQELAVSLLKDKRPAEREFAFKSFADKTLKKEEQRTIRGLRSVGSYKAMKWCINNDEWGLNRRFGSLDIREITTSDFTDYMAYLDDTNPKWAASTKNIIQSTFRNVMKLARNDRIIDHLPETPRSRQKDNPRPFFQFYPLVSKDRDVYQRILESSRDLSDRMEYVRGIRVTDELYDLILFVTHSFVRPITSELFALRHRDVSIAEEPKRLILTIRDGKTGYRVANTMEAAVTVFERIKKRNIDAKPDDFLFLPQYENRITAGKVVQRQFKRVMENAEVQVDQQTGMKHSIYSLRHTAICMRIILSQGQVNIFNLAKNAGTSVEQIERFYARNLPLSAEMARNLQSFGA